MIVHETAKTITITTDAKTGSMHKYQECMDWLTEQCSSLVDNEVFYLMEELKPGTVLMDINLSSLLATFTEIGKEKTETRIGSKLLIDLLEAIVLHEKIFIIDYSLVEQIWVNGWARPSDNPKLLQPLKGLVGNPPISAEMQEVIDKGFAFHQDNSLWIASQLGIPYKNSVDLQDASPTSISQNNYYTNFYSHILKLLAAQATIEADEMNSYLNEFRFKIEAPLIFNYIIQEKGWKGESVIETALRVRESKEARAFRKVCAEFDIAARIGDTRTLYKLKREIDIAVEGLNKRYQQPTYSLGFQFPPVAISTAIENIKPKRKHHLVFIDNVYEMAVRDEGLRRALNRLF